MERIEIRNFGLIKEIDLDIKDFMLLVGYQEGGESRITRLIFFFKSLNNELIKFFIELIEGNNFSRVIGSYVKRIRKRYFEYFGENYDKDFFAKYYYSDDIWIEISLDKGGKYITPKFSVLFLERFRVLVGEVKEFSLSIREGNRLLTSKDLFEVAVVKKKFFAYIRGVCNSIFGGGRELIFIPAGRGMLSTLSDQLERIDRGRLDGVMGLFLERVNLVRPIFQKFLSEIIEERRVLNCGGIDYDRLELAEKLIRRILGGRYRYDSDGEKIFFDNGRYIRLKFCSSGQKEALWMVLLIFLVLLEDQQVFMVIEEPEAHISPKVQEDILNLIALMCNTGKSQVLVTSYQWSITNGQLRITNY